MVSRAEILRSPAAAAALMLLGGALYMLFIDNPFTLEHDPALQVCLKHLRPIPCEYH